MKTLNLNTFGPIIGSKSVGEEIYTLIKKSLEDTDVLTIQIDGIKSMATFCAKQIFGRLYLDLGSESFFERIISPSDV